MVTPSNSRDALGGERYADVLQLLGRYSASHVEATRQLARALDVHPTDAVAVAEIMWSETAGQALTPVRLGARIGLSSGAITALLNRLEAAGHVVRAREDVDRRVVRLHLVEKTRADTETFFAASADQLAAVLEQYDDGTLTQIKHFLSEVTATVDAHNTNLERRDTSLGVSKT